VAQPDEAAGKVKPVGILVVKNNPEIITRIIDK
jgi:hypothetical protein